MIDSRKLGLTLFVSHTERDKYRNNNEWERAAASLKSYEIQGKRYQLVGKYERHMQCFSLERIWRVALGCFCCLCTLGFALISTTVQRLFTGRQVVRILQFSEPTTADSKNTPLIQAPQSTPLVEASKSELFNKLDWQATPKVLAGSEVEDGTSFVPLPQDQVLTLLKSEPSLKTRDAAM